MKSHFVQLGLSLAAGVLLIGLTGANAATVKSNFGDLSDGHPFLEAIVDMQKGGIVKGYPDNTFRADRTINRAEFVAMIRRSKGLEPGGENCFTDVTAGEWYVSEVCAAKNAGWIKGYAEGEFKPAQNINAVEASKIIAVAYDLRLSESDALAPWYWSMIKALSELNAIPVTIDFPEQKITRSEVAEMLTRLNKDIRTRPTKTFSSLTSSFPNIASCEELSTKISMAAHLNRRQQFSIFDDEVMMPLMDSQPAVLRSIQAPVAESADAGFEIAPDFSTTNVQVEGVDEADVVKTDGEYIYYLNNQKVRVLKARPAANLVELDEVKMPSGFDAIDMYITNDDLVVIGNSYGEKKSKTSMRVYDISDPASVVEKRTFDFDGNLVSSRKIDNRVYIVANDFPGYNYYEPIILEADSDSVIDILPTFRDSKTGDVEPLVGCDQVRFYPRFTDPNFLVVASVDLTDETSQAVSREVFMGTGGTVFASQDNIYVAASHYQYDENVRYDIWEPRISNESTIFYRFSLDDGAVNYEGRGLVPGSLLNQFSMDEHDGYFRVATTEGNRFFGDERQQQSGIYTMAVDNLETIKGKIEGIAPGESIHSVRFIGDRAYMVTFKKVDPFFVIDLEDPAAPKILGELKIPGYSNYLHPIDENHLLGFGKDAIDANEFEGTGFTPRRGFDFAWYQGMKIALFDVTNVANPTLKFNEIIGDRGTDSELLNNHRALMFDRARNIFAFPVAVHELSDKVKAGPRSGSEYGDRTFQGAYVYKLDLDTGFDRLGEITHYTAEEQKLADDEYRYSYSDDIERIIYIGDEFFTLSRGTVRATNGDTFEATAQVELRGVDYEPDASFIESMPVPLMAQ